MYKTTQILSQYKTIMDVKTTNVITNVDADKLFNFLAKVENHPKWATEFIQELRKEGDDYKVVPPVSSITGLSRMLKHG